MITKTFFIGDGIILTVHFNTIKNYREFIKLTELEPEKSRYEQRHNGERKK